MRFSTTGQSFDEVVRKIDELIVAARDVKSEKEIQRIYASEASIQQQYKKK